MQRSEISAPRADATPLCILQIALGILLSVFATDAVAQKPARYAGMLANGQRLSGDKLSDWHQKETMPRLENQALLDAGNPLKWLCDRALPLPAVPVAFLETQTGDIVPGTVVDAQMGQESTWAELPPHLVVEPAIELSPPGKPAATTIRVLISSLRRIVWQRQSRQAYQPGHVFFRDGRSLSYRALRFGPGVVSVLLESGTQRIAWSDLAEVHLPKVDFWPAYFDDLTGTCASASSRLMQLETSSGLVATSSLDRFVPRFDGNPQEQDRWVHGIQPAWSLDILWVPCGDVVVRRIFGANQVPLSRVPPASVVSQSLLAGTGPPPQVNRNIYGGPLQSGLLEFGWGFGVQARSELTFELPEGVKAIRGSVSIDRTSARGGCVRARVFANATGGSPLWESPILVGSETVADMGSVALGGPKAGQTHVVLQVDPLHEGRPAGADPLDIRDAADWHDPLLELDPAFVQEQLDQRLAQRFFAWQKGNVRLEPGAPQPGIQVAYQRNENLPSPARFDTFVGHAARGIVIAQTFQLHPQDEWLVLSAVRQPNGPQPGKLEVRIGNEPIADYEPPAASKDLNDVRPLAISLAPYQQTGAKSIQVEVRQPAAEGGAPLHWRALEVAPQLPTLYRVFEDQPHLPPLADAIVTQERHYGLRSIRVRRGETVDIPLPQPVLIRERPGWGEYRFLRFAIRKKGKGRVAVDVATVPERIQTTRYDAGKGEPVGGKAMRIWNEELPEQWIVLTRDLYADFGLSDVTQLTLSCPDGEAAWFDHVYLARSQDDFKLIPAAPSPEQTNQKAREEVAARLVERVRPAIVTIELPDGRVGGGIIVSKEGEILAAGHFLQTANQDAKVRLAEGMTVPARSLGISRELDLGLLKISQAGKWPALALDSRKEVDSAAPYVAMLFPERATADSPPAMKIASLRRFFRTTLWTDVDAETFTSGGALLDPQGQALGLHIGRSQFGGFLFTRLHAGDLKPHLDRMRRGEIFGAWPAGSEPLLGLEGQTSNAGLEVIHAAENGPAAKAGIQRGDLVTRVDGKPIVTRADLQTALSEKDAGSPLAVELQRGSAIVSASVTLAPRVP